jgi:adenosylcobinamide-phosphate synthase
MRGVESRLYADRVDAGAVHAATGVALAVAAGSVLHASLPRLGSAGATYLTVAGRGLWDAAAAVATPLERDDLAGARHLLPALVGRDPEDLDAKEIARAVVESVAENTVDGIVAPALWAAAGGAVGTLGYRAVNTLDSMVGHRSARYERYGKASARLDDAANWIPARLTATLVAVTVPARAGSIWRALRGPARRHPSPNAGVAEAAFAVALGLRLGGTNIYQGRVDVRPPLGDGRPPEAGDIARAVRLSQKVTAALVLGLLVTGAQA